MVEHDDILRKALDVIERLGLRYMIVGSVASSLYGEPRSTVDVDIVLDLPQGAVNEFCASFPSPDFYLEPIAVREAIRRGRQFNLLHIPTGSKIDFMALRYGTHDEIEIERRQLLPLLGDRSAYVARPEDVILGKMEFYRQGESEKHLRDITGILKMSADVVDREYIQSRAVRMGLLDIWRLVLDRMKDEKLE